MVGSSSGVWVGTVAVSMRVSSGVVGFGGGEGNVALSLAQFGLDESTVYSELAEIFDEFGFEAPASANSARRIASGGSVLGRADFAG